MGFLMDLIYLIATMEIKKEEGCFAGGVRIGRYVWYAEDGSKFSEHTTTNFASVNSVVTEVFLLSV